MMIILKTSQLCSVRRATVSKSLGGSFLLASLVGFFSVTALLGSPHGAANVNLDFFESMGVEEPAAADPEILKKQATQQSGISREISEILNPDNPLAVTAEIERNLEANAEPVPIAKDERFFNEALDYYHAMDQSSAISAFVKLLNYSNVSSKYEKQALIYLSRIYYQMDMPLRTISLLELYVEYFPEDPRREEIIFQTGLLYREIGQQAAAIAAFYRVLNSIIIAGETQVKQFIDLARKAQFEIARTHFEMEEWSQALDLFERIALFELSEKDRETLRYYKIKSLLFVGQRGRGLSEINVFSEEYPESPFLPELLYEKARANIEIAQVETGRETLMNLVEMGGLPENNITVEWMRWRQFAGNFLSNYYYKKGDYQTALRLYQGIVMLDKSPHWQLPIVMQMANCFRHLDRPERAKESLQFIVQEVGKMRNAAKSDSLSVELDYLEESAAWHLNLLEWREEFDGKIDSQVGMRAN